MPSTRSANIEQVRFKESGAPSSPPSGYGYLYEKADGKLYFKNDAGTEFDLTSAAGGSNYQTVKDAGTPLTGRAALNLVAGSGIGLTIADDSGNNETDVTVAVSTVPVANGGTNAATASAARTNLGLAIGTDVAAAAHTHTAADIASGVLDNARVNFAAPAAIGSTTPAAGTFSTLSVGSPNALTIGSGGTITAIGGNVNAVLQAGLLQFAASNPSIVNANSGGTLSLQATTPNTNNAIVMSNFNLRHRLASGGTPAAGFGTELTIQLESSTTDDQAAGSIIASWSDATHATRSADLVLGAYNVTTRREGLRIRGGASAAQIGFFGATPVARQTGYTAFANLTTDRTLDANSTTLDEVADVLGTLIEDLKTLGLIAA